MYTHNDIATSFKRKSNPKVSHRTQVNQSNRKHGGPNENTSASSELESGGKGNQLNLLSLRPPCFAAQPSNNGGIAVTNKIKQSRAGEGEIEIE